MKKKFIIIFLLVLISTNCFSQSEPKEHNLSTIISNDFSSFIDDFGYIGNGIINLDWNDIACFGGIASGTALLFLADENIRENVQNNRSNKLDDFFYYPNEMGGQYSVGFPILFYLSGIIAKDEDLRTTGRLMGEAFLLSGVITQTLKIGFGRARPFLNKGNTVFQPFSFKDPYFALPSGHTTAIFSLATVFAFKYDKWWSYTIGYSLALSTAMARIYYDKHWTSDVFLGSAIGFVSGVAIVNAFRHNSILKKKNLKISYSPMGINLEYRF